MDFIREELYFEAVDFANKLAHEVSVYYSKNIEKIKCFDIEDYIIEKDIAEIIYYDFKKQLRDKMLGSTTKILNEVLITINKNLMCERRNFTEMHEIVHLYKDIPYAKEGHTFSDMISENGYFSEDLPKEYRANVGASVLMANDLALKYALNKFSSFEEVAKYFFMSKAALFNRLTEYLIFIKNCHPVYARCLVNEYRYKREPEILDFFY
ncbi:ImmA/IrrE family metallo-endopeptidase [Enterococcus faecium]|nr:ImmA/IrrE family metallo-endopeptidase [Enterococcus faecium]